jgi:hypothetical protein
MHFLAPEKVNHSTLHLILKVTIVYKTEEKNIQKCRKCKSAEKADYKSPPRSEYLPPVPAKRPASKALYYSRSLTDMTIT